MSLLVIASCGRDQQSGSEDQSTDEMTMPAISVGTAAPQFKMASLSDPESKLSRDSLDGKVVLIDFWATWCLPCVAELPNLHAAYEVYHDRGFEILSVALGDNREHIGRLRETEWPMPWLHAFEPLDSESALAFEAYSLPKAILVDADGIIVGLDEEVRGTKLHETLGRLLGDSN